MNNTRPIFAGILVVIFAVLFGILIVLREIPVAAVTAILGVLLGGSITGLVQYWISEMDRAQQLRLASLDRRLDTHQKAYSLWRKLLFADKQNGEVHEVVAECEDWWETNCVFLTTDAREAFIKAYISASTHPQLLATHEKSELVKANWRNVERAGDIILQGVYLPAISVMENKRVGDH